MNPERRLAEIVDGIRRIGIPCLVMGGHAVRFYGIDRTTIDYDLHIAVESGQWSSLLEALKVVPVLDSIREGPSWRPGAFRRFVIGTLADGREERLECWRRNHLLAPFPELFERREQGVYGGAPLDFLGIDDLIRSKETERLDDWHDVRLLEEIADERRIARAVSARDIASAISRLRSRKGFDLVCVRHWLDDQVIVEAAVRDATHPLPLAFLAPYAPERVGQRTAGFDPALTELITGLLGHVRPSSVRHLALVEALRRRYQQLARAADRADKERAPESEREASRDSRITS